jgi:hypothetical protein
MQYEPFECQTRAGKFSILLFAFLQCSILLNLYSSWILANIIQRDIKVSDKSVAHVLKLLNGNEGYYFATDVPDLWLFDMVNHSSGYPYAEFREALQRNPLRIMDNVGETLNEIIKGKAMTFMQDDDRVNFYSRRFCHFESIRLGMPEASRFWGNSKGLIRWEYFFKGISHIVIERNGGKDEVILEGIRCTARKK